MATIPEILFAIARGIESGEFEVDSFIYSYPLTFNSYDEKFEPNLVMTLRENKKD